MMIRQRTTSLFSSREVEDNFIRKPGSGYPISVYYRRNVSRVLAFFCILRIGCAIAFRHSSLQKHFSFSEDHIRMEQYFAE